MVVLPFDLRLQEIPSSSAVLYGRPFYIYVHIPCLFLVDELCIFSLNIKDLAYTNITGRSQFLNRISGTNNKKRLKAGQRLQRECAWVIGYNITQHKPNYNSWMDHGWSWCLQNMDVLFHFFF